MRRANPGDVVADRPDFPAVEALRRNHHGEVGLAAGAGKGRGHVGLFAFGALHADDEHVLGHPALVARDVGGDAQGEALLAQQRVAAVARAVGPDLARFREVDDVFLVVAGPGNIGFAGRERHADAMHAGDDALHVAVDLAEDGQADAGHDPHVHDDVRRIGELDADLRHRRADRAHAEGQHIHGAAAHGAAKKILQLLAHLERVFPVIGRPGVVFGKEQIKVRSSTRATSRASERA